MTLWKQIIVLATLCLAMRASRTYALTPEEFAVKEWANKNLVNELSDACKTADNPEHCFGVWLSISKAESQMGNDPKAISHWYFGRVGSKDKSAYWFVSTYKKKYYIVNKYNEWGMFYGYASNRSAPTNYCLSEVQPNGKVIEWHCPNGRASFNFIYSKYRQEVMGDDKQEVAKVELKRNIASKTPAVVAWSKRCKIIMNAPADWYIQIDSIAWKFLARLKNIRKSDKIFFCWDIK